MQFINLGALFQNTRFETAKTEEMEKCATKMSSGSIEDAKRAKLNTRIATAESRRRNLKDLIMPGWIYPGRPKTQMIMLHGKV